MAKSKINIDPGDKWGGRFGLIHQLLLRNLLLVGGQYAPYYRAFATSLVFLVVGTGLIWWGYKGDYLGLTVAGMLVFLLAETIWLGVGVVLLWKLVRTVIDRFRAGQRGVPGRDRNRTLSDL